MGSPNREEEEEEEELGKYLRVGSPDRMALVHVTGAKCCDCLFASTASHTRFRA